MLQKITWPMLLLCLPLLTTAQWRLGPRLGIGFPLLQTSAFRPTSNGTSILGFHVGAEVEYQFGRTAGADIAFGAQLARLGGEVLTSESYHQGGRETLFSAYFYALQCPLTIGYHGSLSQLPLYIALGLQPEWGLWGQQSVDTEGAHPIAWQKDMARFGLSVVLRTGVELPRWPLQIGIYMDYGILDLKPSEGKLVSVAYGFSLAYLIGLGGANAQDGQRHPVAQ